MSILAEPRRKQKISSDPQNRHWTKNDNKFGQKLLEKLGWKEGDGLGANQSGISAPIKLKPNSGQSGLGSSAVDYDKVWIDHQNDFNSVLSGLSDDKTDEPSEANVRPKWSLEEKSKTSRNRIHYHKYARMKDLSSRSQSDLACIIAVDKVKSKKLEVDPNIKEETDLTKTEVKEENFNGKISNETISDYFARRLAEIKAGTKSEVKAEEGETGPDDIIGEAVEANEEAVEKKKKRKKTKRHDLEEKIEENEVSEETKPKKKKKRKNQSDTEEV